jgi:spore coat polysaccharide biosynthesis protein SpsF
LGSPGYEEWLDECLEITKADVFIMDVRDGLDPKYIAKVRRRGIFTVTIDDPEDKRLSTDLAFYPPVPQIYKMDWSGFTGTLYCGWEYVILRDEFRSKFSIKENKYPKLLITMGGSDPENLTLQVLKSVEKLPTHCDIDILIGPGFTGRNELEDFLKKTKKNTTVYSNLTDPAELFSSSDLAIVSFGTTAYELARVGIPAIYLCLSEDHIESASLFEKNGLGIIAGRYDKVDGEILIKHIIALLNDKQKRLNMKRAGPDTIDGKGAERISTLIFKHLNLYEI